MMVDDGEFKLDDHKTDTGREEANVRNDAIDTDLDVVFP